jgi:nicotinate-nucleotide adenylyltransferase
MASADDRLAMCRLAADQDPLFEVSDIELRRAGPSYTIDTARELRRSGWSAVPWLIGSDNVPQLPTWHEPAALLAEIQFVVMQRPGSLLDWTTVAPAWQVLKARVVVAPLIEISASDIRRRIYDGKSVRYLTPASVTDYMIHRRLYI